MRYRQVHLDFHTGGDIEDVGALFDATEFAEQYADANVESVTVFSKCHHGYSYHPTKIGQQHPNLAFDLLRAQIDALHAKGIAAPVYLSAAWDYLSAENNVDWINVDPDGKLIGFRNQENKQINWPQLDFASPYLNYLEHQLGEVLQGYPDADGIFLDICFQSESISTHTVAQMEANGLDWTDKDHRRRFTAQKTERFFDAMTDIVRKYDTKMPLFFNTGHIRRGARQHYQSHYSHLEIESLPTASWGYDAFPTSARYAEGLGLPLVSMTGKFNFVWGEMGSFKSPDALVYEAATALSHGAALSVGDHLHPTSKVDKSTMKVIKAGFDWIAQREEWAKDSKNVAQVGVLSVEANKFDPLAGLITKEHPADVGLVRVLLESKLCFDLLDSQSSLDAYDLVILPDEIRIDSALKTKIDGYLENGGRILATGTSAIDERDGFQFDFGGIWRGKSQFEDGEFILPIKSLRSDIVETPLFTYFGAQRVSTTDGHSLGDVYSPYFSRSPRQFSGHMNTPPQPNPNGNAAGLYKNGRFYCAFPIFSAYKKTGSVALLQIAKKLICFALGKEPTIKTDLPIAGRASLRHQQEKNRFILHLNYATPVSRGEILDVNIQPIQDFARLSNIRCEISVGTPVTGVCLVPEMIDLPFLDKGNSVDFTVPEIYGAQLVEIRTA